MRLLALASLLALWGAAACDDACTELANQICKCEQTESRQQACVTQVESQADVDPPTAAEEERCEGYLETCTCDALAAGDLAACGLANSPR